jgi:hypothetical protein
MASGNVITDLTDRHRAQEFIRFLNLINRRDGCGTLGASRQDWRTR